jgi:hypothetical protein
VADSNCAATQCDRGEGLAILDHVDEGTGATLLGRSRFGGGRSAGKGDGTKVGQGNETTVLLEVLDNPLSILASEGSL